MFNSPQAKVAKDDPPVKANLNIVKAAKGGSIIFFGNLFEAGSRFVFAILLTRLLGAQQFGLYRLALSAGTMGTGIALFGLNTALVRYVSLYANRRDSARLWGTIQICLGLTTFLSVIFGLVLYLLAEPIASYLFNEPQLVDLLQVTSLVIPILALGNSLAAATQGFKEMRYTVIANNIVLPLIKLFLLVLLALVIGLNAMGALVIHIVALMIASIMLLYFLSGLFSLRRPLNTAKYEWREIFNFSFPLYLSSLIGTFKGNIQTLLLGSLSTITSVGIFAVASQVNSIGIIFHRSIVTISRPIVSELYDQGAHKELSNFYQTITKWTLTVNIPFFLLILLFPKPILSVFGKSFVGGETALTILAWATLANASTGICGVILDMTGRTTLKFINSLFVFVLTVGLNLLLIPDWGLMGAAIASLASITLVNLLRLGEVFVLFRLFPYNLSFFKPIGATFGALLCVTAMNRFLPGETNLLYTLINAALLTIAYFSFILLLGLSEEDRFLLDRVFKRIRGRLNRK